MDQDLSSINRINHLFVHPQYHCLILYREDHSYNYHYDRKCLSTRSKPIVIITIGQIHFHGRKLSKLDIKHISYPRLKFTLSAALISNRDSKLLSEFRQTFFNMLDTLFQPVPCTILRPMANPKEISKHETTTCWNSATSGCVALNLHCTRARCPVANFFRFTAFHFG